MRAFTIGCVALGVLSLPIAAKADSGPATNVSAKKSDIVATVNGMVCDFCARAVSKVFGKNSAVDMVYVDLDAGEIHVDLKPGQTLDDETVTKLVRKSGYALVSINRAVAE